MMLFVHRFFGLLFVLFFFNDTATTEIYTLSLHDALPISGAPRRRRASSPAMCCSRSARSRPGRTRTGDRKSTRLNSSHSQISYAVFCLKKKTDCRKPFVEGERTILEDRSHSNRVLLLRLA